MTAFSSFSSRPRASVLKLRREKHWLGSLQQCPKLRQPKVNYLQLPTGNYNIPWFKIIVKDSMFVKADHVIYQLVTLSYVRNNFFLRWKEKKTYRSASLSMKNDVNDTPQSSVMRRWESTHLKAPSKLEWLTLERRQRGGRTLKFSWRKIFKFPFAIVIRHFAYDLFTIQVTPIYWKWALEIVHSARESQLTLKADLLIFQPESREGVLMGKSEHWKPDEERTFKFEANASSKGIDIERFPRPPLSAASYYLLTLLCLCPSLNAHLCGIGNLHSPHCQAVSLRLVKARSIWCFPNIPHMIYDGSVFSFGFRRCTKLFLFCPLGNLALCRFHSRHVAFRKPILLTVYSGLSPNHPPPLRNQGYRGFQAFFGIRYSAFDLK